MVRGQNLLHMYSLILDIGETANFDFPFPHASSYQAKPNLVLGDSQNALMSTTVSSEACLLQGRLGEWVRESSQSNNNKFNDHGVLRNKFCSTEAGHIKSNDILHLAYDGPVSENDCIIEHGISNSKIDSNGSYDKLVSPVKGEHLIRAINSHLQPVVKQNRVSWYWVIMILISRKTKLQSSCG